MSKCIDIRYDDGTDEFVLTADLVSLMGREFEIRNRILSVAVLEMSEAIENEGW